VRHVLFSINFAPVTTRYSHGCLMLTAFIASKTRYKEDIS
jgi:hypothetical protein